MNEGEGECLEGIMDNSWAINIFDIPNNDVMKCSIINFLVQIL